jgi:hypothetical protein
MSVMMDIIVASILAMVITLITINANLVIREAWASYNSTTMVQQLLISDAQIVESEFRNMGCGVDITTESVLLEARDTCISFKMALRPEPGITPSIIKYYSGNASELLATDNPADRFLYRQKDGGTAERVGVVTSFNLRYFSFQNDTLPTPVSNLSNVGLVEVTLEVQSSFASFIDLSGQKRYASALWKQTRLASQNLRR